MSNYLNTLRIGDYADIIVDGAIHKGMPHQYYHGRTGRIFSVNKRSVGIHMLKRVRQRKMDKHIFARIEHVRVSNTRKAFVERVQANDKIKTEANKKKVLVSTKRQIEGPKEGHVVKIDLSLINYRTQKPFIELH